MTEALSVRACDLPALRAGGYIIGEMEASGLRPAYPPVVEISVENEERITDLERDLDSARAVIARLKGAVQDAEGKLALATGQCEISFQSILDGVAEHYNVPAAALMGDCRLHMVSIPRQVFCWVCAEITGPSNHAIGIFLGRRDATTISAARRRIKALRLADSSFRDNTDDLRRDIIKSHQAEAAL